MNGSQADLERAIEQTTDAIIARLDEKKGEEIVKVDLRGRSSIADFFVIATGRSSTHVTSLADEIDQLASQQGLKTLNLEGMEEGNWVLMDFGDIIVHIFQEEVRGHYNLEKLWSREALEDRPHLESSAEIAGKEIMHASDLDEADSKEDEDNVA
uniref:Ribosomal silencing factor RsfS n=1 Tax=Magnetococcus massalia (strain MO-1) TaxID=451514 RepID=A0A1S7LNB2_MAGMO|nr:Conserved protein of unknown function [Candidatus Magnetococcus massalia]